MNCPKDFPFVLVFSQNKFPRKRKKRTQGNGFDRARARFQFAHPILAAVDPFTKLGLGQVLQHSSLLDRVHEGYVEPDHIAVNEKKSTNMHFYLACRIALAYIEISTHTAKAGR